VIILIEWACGNCRKETEHKIKPTKQKKFGDHRIVICQTCGTKEMVPVRVLDNDEKVGFTISESTGNDGGFDRDVGSDCDSGICPVR